MIKIDGVILTRLRQIMDERGGVLHMFRNDAPEYKKFGECYFSEVLPGSVKAWKLHKKQSQNLAVPIGRIRLVIFDPRKVSPSYLKLQVIELGRPDAYFRLHIPNGLWYGFSCISKDRALIVNCADMIHDSDETQIMPIEVADIPYSW